MNTILPLPSQQMMAKIAYILGAERFPTGDRARFRRMNPVSRDALPLVFYRFALEYLPKNWDCSPETTSAWVTLVAGIALMSPGAHDPHRGLGMALAKARYSEARLERLLAAFGNTRCILLLRVARFLAAKNGAFDWTDAVCLLLTRAPEKIESLHRRIAYDFYANQTKQNKEE